MPLPQHTAAPRRRREPCGGRARRGAGRAGGAGYVGAAAASGRPAGPAVPGAGAREAPGGAAGPVRRRCGAGRVEPVGRPGGRG